LFISFAKIVCLADLEECSDLLEAQPKCYQNETTCVIYLFDKKIVGARMRKTVTLHCVDGKWTESGGLPESYLYILAGTFDCKLLIKVL
jgi:hypothetical protein